MRVLSRQPAPSIRRPILTDVKAPIYFSSKAGSLSKGRSACTYESSMVFVDGTSGGLDEVLALVPSAGCALSLSAQKP